MLTSVKKSIPKEENSRYLPLSLNFIAYLAFKKF